MKSFILSFVWITVGFIAAIKQSERVSFIIENKMAGDYSPLHNLPNELKDRGVNVHMKKWYFNLHENDGRWDKIRLRREDGLYNKKWSRMTNELLHYWILSEFMIV